MEQILHGALIVISILIIALVLLQGAKTDGASSIITGGNDSLFANRKERGSELFLTRLTMILGILFIGICMIIGF